MQELVGSTIEAVHTPRRAAARAPVLEAASLAIVAKGPGLVQEWPGFFDFFSQLHFRRSWNRGLAGKHRRNGATLRYSEDADEAEGNSRI